MYESQRLLNQQKIRSIGVGIYLSHAPTVSRLRVKTGCPEFDSGLFLAAASVAGVNRDQHYPARSNKLQRLVQCGDGCLRKGNDGAIAAREVAEVEQHCLQRGCDMQCHVFVADMKQRYPLRKPRLSQFFAGFSNRLLLNIKRIYMAVSANEAGQQQGVVTVATGRINCRMTGTDKITQKQVRKRNRSAQRRYGYGHLHEGRG